MTRYEFQQWMLKPIVFAIVFPIIIVQWNMMVPGAFLSLFYYHLQQQYKAVASMFHILQIRGLRPWEVNGLSKLELWIAAQIGCRQLGCYSIHDGSSACQQLDHLLKSLSCIYALTLPAHTSPPTPQPPFPAVLPGLEVPDQTNFRTYHFVTYLATFIQLALSKE